MILVPVGSRYENKKLGGASHFVEHLMFKGTKKRPSNLDISRALDAVGAHYNAMTHKEYTGYYIKIDSRKEELAMDVLSDMLFNSLFETEEIDKEKGVIIEEIKMYEDNPMAAVEDLAELTIFGDHPLGRNIAGTIQNIKDMSRNDLWHYYKSAYAPENMVLVVAGSVGENTKKLAAKYFGQVQSRAKINKNNFEKITIPRNVPLNRRLTVQKRKIDQAHVFFTFPGLKRTDPKRYALSVLLNILGGGMSSRLFVEVREKRGLAYRVRVEAASYRDTGAVHIVSGLDQNRLPEAFSVIQNELKRISRELVSGKELIGAKNNLAGSLTLMMENSHIQAEWFAGHFWFGNKIEDYKQEIINIKKVTAKQVLNLAADIFKKSEMRVTVISSKNKKQILKLI